MDTPGNTQPARRGAVLRLACSTWTAAAIIALLAAYLSVVSVWAKLDPQSLDGLIGIDAQRPYGHPLPVSLWALLCVNLIFASVLRVRLDLPRLGAWISHLGMLVLAAGACWYWLGHESGMCFTQRTPEGWSPISRFHPEDRFAAYVSIDGREPVQAALPSIGRARRPVELDVFLGSWPDGLTVRATRFLPHGRLVERVADDSPGLANGVRLELAAGPHRHELTLAELPGRQSFQGRGYFIVYQPDMTPETLASAADPAGPVPPVAELVLICQGPQIAPTLVVARQDGWRHSERIVPGEPVALELGGAAATITVRQFLRHAALHVQAEQAEPDDPQGVSALVVELAKGDWRASEAIAFFGLGWDAEAARHIDLPGGQSAEVVFSRASRPLGADIDVLAAEYQTHEGSVVPKDYVCDVRVRRGESIRRETISLNNPLRVGGYQISQDTWQPSPHRPMLIVLGVRSRPGVGLIWAGMVMTALGFPWAFYVKPLLLRRRQGDAR